MSPKTFGFPPGVWCCQRHRAQNLPGGQDVRFSAYQFLSVPLCLCLPCFLFFSFFFLVSHSVLFLLFSFFFPFLLALITRPPSLSGGAECKYSFSLSRPPGSLFLSVVFVLFIFVVVVVVPQVPGSVCRLMCMCKGRCSSKVLQFVLQPLMFLFHRLLSSVKNNVGRGLNIALVNGKNVILHLL